MNGSQYAESVYTSSATHAFQPVKLVVLSELSTREKERYYQLLLLHGAKFRRDANATGKAQYVCNVRLLAPGVRRTAAAAIGGEGSEKRRRDATDYALILQDRLARLKSEGFISVAVQGLSAAATASFEYNAYPRFAALIAFHGEAVRPKLRPLAWVMKHIEDVYDHRFAHERHDVERDPDETSSFDVLLAIFPVFVVRRLGTNVGLKSLVDQSCWDLLYSLHVYRRDYLEVETFARFLQEFYDHDDLLFFLYVRSVVGKVLHVNFKNRWVKPEGPGRQAKPLWMSFREAAHVAKLVFGADNEEMCREFMSLVTPQMVGMKNDLTDSRRIDITEYLHLSVVGYHQSQSRNQQGNERFLVPLPGQTAPIEPVPLPPSALGMAVSGAFDNDNLAAYDANAPKSSSAFGTERDRDMQQQQREMDLPDTENDNMHYNLYTQNNYYNINNPNNNAQGAQPMDSAHGFSRGEEILPAGAYDLDGNNDYGYFGGEYDLPMENNNNHYDHNYDDDGNGNGDNNMNGSLIDAEEDFGPYPAGRDGAPYDNGMHDLQGYDPNGYDPNGYNEQGFDPQGYGAQAFDPQQGYMQDGVYHQNDEYQQEGYDAQDYNPQEYDPRGYENGQEGNEFFDPAAAAASAQGGPAMDYYYNDAMPVMPQEQGPIDTSAYGEENGSLQQDVSSYQDSQPSEQTGMNTINAFQELQQGREQEFMSQLLAPLQDLHPDVFVYAEDQLLERLHDTVSEFLADKEIYTLQALDDALLEILQLDQLRIDMEMMRDEIVQSAMASGEY